MSNPDNPDFNKKLETRISRPTTMAGAFGGLFNIFGHRASDTDLFERWDEIMGNDIAKISRPITIKKTIGNKFSIVIKPTNPALALELSYNRDEILRRINKYFGYSAISKITFKK